MADLEEIRIALAAIKDFTNLPVIASMAFSCTLKGFRTIIGIEARGAVSKLWKMGASAVGVNCGGLSVEDATRGIKKMKEMGGGYLVARPNAGSPRLVNGKMVYPVTLERMGREALNWVNAGANIVSGCCGSTVKTVFVTQFQSPAKKRFKFIEHRPALPSHFIPQFL